MYPQQTTSNKFPKKLMLIAGGIFVIGIALVSILYFLFTTQSVSVTVHDGATATIYTAKSGKGLEHTNQVVATITGTQTKRLGKNQGYIAITQETSDFQSTTQRFDVEGSDVSVDIHPNYTDKRLADLFTEQKAALNQAIITAFPKVSSLYTIADGKMFGQGDWYGTALTYKGPDKDNSDTLHVILRKDGDQWKVSTTPPQIAISQLSHPAIPLEIVQAVNQLK